MHSVLPDLPVRYNLCTHSLSVLFGYHFGELCISVQQVYENAVGFRFLSTVRLTAMRGSESYTYCRMRYGTSEVDIICLHTA